MLWLALSPLLWLAPPPSTPLPSTSTAPSTASPSTASTASTASPRCRLAVLYLDGRGLAATDPPGLVRLATEGVAGEVARLSGCAVLSQSDGQRRGLTAGLRRRQR